MAANVFATAQFWLTIVVVYVSAFGWRYAERTAAWLFRPHDTMILVRCMPGGWRHG